MLFENFLRYCSAIVRKLYLSVLPHVFLSIKKKHVKIQFQELYCKRPVMCLFTILLGIGVATIVEILLPVDLSINY